MYQRFETSLVPSIDDCAEIYFTKKAKTYAKPTEFKVNWVYLLDFFFSSIRFYVQLLSLFLCFISFLYLDLYVFGNDALIS